MVFFLFKDVIFFRGRGQYHLESPPEPPRDPKLLGQRHLGEGEEGFGWGWFFYVIGCFGVL